MENRRILIVFGLVILSVFSSFLIRDDDLTTLIKKMDAFNLAHPQEKVHLHLDKPAYRAGEDIWFRAYVINPADSKLSRLSGVLHVDLISPQDSLLQSHKIQITNGMADGDFNLPDTLNAGFYRIRAYTQLMRNLGPDFFFDQLVRVDHPSGKQVYASATYTYLKEKTIQQVQALLQFTDESGQPYVSRDISYQLQIAGKVLLDGRDKTNNKGEVNIIWNNPPAGRSGGSLSARIMVADAVTVYKQIPVKALADSSLVQFFPEGGELLEGITSKIACKAINAGLPEAISGVIVDQTGKAIKTFQSTYAGIGSFTFRPLAGSTYTAKLKFADGSEKVMPLPAAKPAGHVLAVHDQSAAEILLDLRTSPASIGNQELNLVAQHNGNILLIFKALPKDTVVPVRIPRNKLPSGIIQLTLFSANLQPLSERLIFNSSPSDRLTVEIKSDKTDYEPRSSVQLTLSSKFPNKAFYSVAVTHSPESAADAQEDSHILSNLLLCSDLSGYVENPAQYFTDSSSKTRQALDNLLLTQRWERFLWKDVLASQTRKPLYSTEKNFRISGTVLSMSGKPVPKARVSLFAPGTGSFVLDTLADANGHFNFDQLVYADGTKFIVQAANAKGKQDVRLKLDLRDEQLITPYKNPSRVGLNARESIAAYLKKNNHEGLLAPTAGINLAGIALKEVRIKGQKKPAVSHSANLNGAGVADQVIQNIDMGTCINLAECLKGRIVGYTLRNDTPFLARSPFLPMMLSLDGVLVDGSRLKDVNPSDIESIEVLKTPINTAIYGSRGIGGVIVINTKREVSGRPTVYTKPWIVSHQPFGFTTGRTFSLSQYTGTNNPDLKRTVYWKPDVETDATGKANLTFYTIDQPGRYRVVAEGINEQGYIGRAVYTFTVREKR
jgi:TonB-dependent SusC/RagA subfamily outer membrane receptor